MTRRMRIGSAVVDVARRRFAQHLDDTANSAATAHVMIGSGSNIIARRVLVLACSAFNPATSPEGGVAFRRRKLQKSWQRRSEEERRSVQFHYHRLDQSALKFIPPPPELLAGTSTPLCCCCCTGSDLAAIDELFDECRVVSFSSSPLSDGFSSAPVVELSFSVAGPESSSPGGGGWL